MEPSKRSLAQVKCDEDGSPPSKKKRTGAPFDGPIVSRTRRKRPSMEADEDGKEEAEEEEEEEEAVHMNGGEEEEEKADGLVDDDEDEDVDGVGADDDDDDDEKDVPPERQALIDELKSMLVPIARKLVTSGRISHILWFDRDDEDNECLWVAKIESPEFDETVDGSLLTVTYPGYGAGEEYTVPVMHLGSWHAWQVSDIVLEPRYVSLLHAGNRKECEEMLSTSTELVSDLSDSSAGDEFDDTSDEDFDVYAGPALRRYARLQAREQGVNLRAQKRTKKAKRRAKAKIRAKIRRIRARRRKARAKLRRARVRAARKPAGRKRATKATVRRKKWGGGGMAMPAKPRDNRWRHTEFDGQNTMDLTGMIPLSGRSLKAPPDDALVNQNEIEIVFSFDTTGSMYSCLDTVRQSIAEMITRLFKDIPQLRVGVIAHGDYCDKDMYYVMRWVDLTQDAEQLTWFVSNVGSTGGGDAPECYELVLHNACREMSWSPSCRFRSLVMIGDERPHDVERNNPHKLDWREKVKDCKACGIKIYGVHCRGNTESREFYKTMSEETEGVFLSLDDIKTFTGMMVAICHREKDLATKPVRSEDYKDEKKRFREACEEFEAFTVADLKKMLSANDQKVSGSKHELIKRCADAKLYGCLPRCTQCGTGRLRVIYANSKPYGHGGNGRFYCPGSYEDGEYKGCTWTGDQDAVNREKWKDLKM